MTYYSTRTEENDPVLEQFLEFLAEDMQKNPQRIQSVSSKLIDRMHALTNGIDVDLDVLLPDHE
jgi:antitoxin PrlF